MRIMLLVFDVSFLKHIESVDEDSFIDLSIFADVSEKTAGLSNRIGINTRDDNFFGSGDGVKLNLDSFNWLDNWLLKSSCKFDDLDVVFDNVDSHGEESESVFHDADESFSNSNDHIGEMFLSTVDTGLFFFLGEPNSDSNFNESLILIVLRNDLDVVFLKGFLNLS